MFLVIPCVLLLMAGCSSDAEDTDGIVTDEEVSDARRELSEAGDKIGAALGRAGEQIGEATDGAAGNLEPLLDDAAITAKIKSKLAGDPEVNAFDVDVDTNAGVVTLTGIVDSRAASSGAEKHARQTDGVVKVQNLLQVRGDST